MSAEGWRILSFPCAASSGERRALRRDLLRTLRISGSPVVVDLSSCRSLNHEDVSLLLECLAQVAGRDIELLLVAGPSAVRILLDVTRISSLVPVFSSLEEALAYPLIAASDVRAGESQQPPSEQFWRAS